MRLTQALLHCSMTSVSRGLLADIFVGPADRLACIPVQPLVFVANHTWRLDVITTTLVTKAMHRTYAVVASRRVARALACVKNDLGLVPLSDSPLQNIGALKSVVGSRQNVALWIFPQAVWIPATWDTRNSVPEVADGVIKLLNRSTPVLPVHIEVIVVRQIRPAVVVTLGEILPPSAALSGRTLGDLMDHVRADAKARLAGHCAEYRSILHDDGALFCGYPIRKQMIARYAKRVLGAQEFNLTGSQNGWDAKLTFERAITGTQFTDALAKALPGVLAASLQRHIRFVIG
jgi:hypothetical protein